VALQSADETEVLRERWLVSSDWLERHLGDPGLRIFDCTSHLIPSGDTTYRVGSGRNDWLGAHIPGAGYIDIQAELSDAASPYRFMLPSPALFESSMQALGVSNDDRIVLYATTTPGWSARVWWMLRAHGFDEVAILDGGFQKWQREGRPISSGPEAVPRGTFRAAARTGYFVDKDAVLSAIDAPDVAIVNALSSEQHHGEGRHYGRPGCISGSSNIPAGALLDPSDGTYLGQSELRSLAQQCGLADASRTIAYCGGGIAASALVFALSLIGMDGLSVYDASLSEWATDSALPMTNSASGNSPAQ
jgi:thiosulfate/3-mercaptopyruvate sulfurtransferase